MVHKMLFDQDQFSKVWTHFEYVSSEAFRLTIYSHYTHLICVKKYTVLKSLNRDFNQIIASKLWVLILFCLTAMLSSWKITSLSG